MSLIKNPMERSHGESKIFLFGFEKFVKLCNFHPKIKEGPV